MHRDVYELSNPGSEEVGIWTEPWAVGFAVPPGETIRFVAVSETPGAFEAVPRGTDVMLYGWAGSMIEVIIRGETIYSNQSPVPPLPPGLSLRQFVEMIFYRRESDRDEAAS